MVIKDIIIYGTAVLVGIFYPEHSSNNNNFCMTNHQNAQKINRDRRRAPFPGLRCNDGWWVYRT